MGKAPLLIRLESYSTYKCREAEYAALIQEKGFVDATNHDAQPKAVNRSYSKVENKGIYFYNINKKLQEARQEMAQIKRYIEDSGLTDQEKEVLWMIAERKKLLSYAKEKGITPSYIYKIRDRALKKVVQYHKMKY